MAKTNKPNWQTMGRDVFVGDVAKAVDAHKKSNKGKDRHGRNAGRIREKKSGSN